MSIRSRILIEIHSITLVGSQDRKGFFIWRGNTYNSLASTQAIILLQEAKLNF